MCPNGFIKIFVIGLLFSACENKGTSTVKDINAEYEGNTAVDYDKVKPSAGNAHGAMGYVHADGESAEESKAKAIQMQIDSAYKSIALLEEAKIALNNTQDELLSAARLSAPRITRPATQQQISDVNPIDITHNVKEVQKRRSDNDAS